MADRRGKNKPTYTADQRRQAYLDYLALGAGRTVWSLHRRYSNLKKTNGESVPTSITLYHWAKKDNWDARAAEHDASVEEKMATILAKEGAAEIQGVQPYLREISILALKNLRSRVLSLPIHNINDAKSLSEVIKTCIFLHESLRGSITEKEDNAVVQQMLGFENVSRERIDMVIAKISRSFDGLPAKGNKFKDVTPDQDDDEE